ncbi:MAG: hypothetical protein ACOH2B_12145 [Burkholderiaceae bacterium]
MQANQDSSAWLVQSVDIADSTESVRVTFKTTPEHHLSVTLAAKPLRQWLTILYDTTKKAE